MPAFQSDTQLADWQQSAVLFESEINRAIIGLETTVHQIVVALFARGHLLLEGEVGTGKTTLLRAVAHCLGGDYSRIEGTVDLLPHDLIYHAHIDASGKPRIDPGPLLQHGEDLSVFFFNEINRARPHIHALLLRLMAERSITAFNREWKLPYLQVFADRNPLEHEETFELPPAARDRFMMEIKIRTPEAKALRQSLIFDTRYHDTDSLLATLKPGLIDHKLLPAFSRYLQENIHASPSLQSYALDIWGATTNPGDFGIALPDVNIADLIATGASTRGMSLMLRAARVNAWLSGRDYLIPEDLRTMLGETLAHRITLTPAYEFRRAKIVPLLIQAILTHIASP